MNNKFVKWLLDNIVCIVLAIIFAVIFVFTASDREVFNELCSCDIMHMEGKYYRWLVTYFLHYNLRHIILNTIAIIAIGSILSPFLGKWKTLLVFILGGFLSEMTFSLISVYNVYLQSAGSSGGIFALMGAMTACVLRFPNAFKIKWYRPDVLIVIAYFIGANSSIPSFLTHTFGFIVGIIFAFLMITFGVIKDTHNGEYKESIR